MIRRRYVVDRIEGKVAVLETDDGRTEDVPLDQLPPHVQQGAVLSVPVSQADAPDWSAARRDIDEERTRLEEARRILEDLKMRDDGGDVVL